MRAGTVTAIFGNSRGGRNDDDQVKRFPCYSSSPWSRVWVDADVPQLITCDSTPPAKTPGKVAAANLFAAFH
jgi:hypothetical protein